MCVNPIRDGRIPLLHNISQNDPVMQHIMNAYHEPRPLPTATISYYQGDTGQRVHLMSGLLLILFALVLLANSWGSKPRDHPDIIDNPIAGEMVKVAFASYPRRVMY